MGVSDESVETTGSNGDNVTNVEHLDHADHVANAAKTDLASVVNHAEKIDLVQVHGIPPPSDKTRRLRYINDITRWLTVLFALVVMVTVIINTSANENRLSHQLTELQNQRTKADRIASDKLECVRRYQDIIDQDSEKQLILLGEFLVVITQNAPGPTREAAVKDKIAELDALNVNARIALKAKIDYINLDTPLPCPLAAAPVLVPPSVVNSTTTTSISPTTSIATS